MSARILTGDVRDMLATLPDASVDAIVTDPPYELGFMGKSWDRSGIAYQVDMWRDVLRVAKPGAHIVAFGGPRTHHRLMVGIEDAGWEIRDCMMWLFGSGFPKSLNLDGEWDGWGTALKPAYEPVVLARKPLSERTVAANVLRWGTGALNIDATRIGCSGGTAGASAGPSNGIYGNGLNGKRGERVEGLGRWPANVILGCCCDGDDHDAECPVAVLDEQSGVLAGGSMPRVRNTTGYSGGLEQGVTGHDGHRLDSGGASRFFYVAKASRAERNRGLEGMPERVVHDPEPNGRAWDIPGSHSTARANHHPTVKPVDLMRWLCRLVTPPGGVVLDPFLGSGTTAIAALAEGFSCIGIEIDPEYAEIARRRIVGDAPLLNAVTIGGVS